MKQLHGLCCVLFILNTVSDVIDVAVIVNDRMMFTVYAHVYNVHTYAYSSYKQ